MEDNYAEGLYEYRPGIDEHAQGIDSAQRVILKIEGRWYLAGWECPLDLKEEQNGMDQVAQKDIGKLLYKLEG